MKKIIYGAWLLASLASTSCKEYLDAKPNEVLTLLSDDLASLQLLLDNTTTMNTKYPAANMLASDDVEITDVNWNALYQQSIVSANAYVWEEDVFNDNDNNDWGLPYTAIFYANLVLDNLNEGENAHAPETEKNNIRGQALFFRAFAYYQLLQQFAKPYHATTAHTDLGIVLRPSSNISTGSKRYTVQECYDRILEDLEETTQLLDAVQLYKTRPNKAAAYGMLAKIWLLMGNYEKALSFAEQCLQMDGKLIDYNKLTAADDYPVPRFNDEVIFHASLLSITGIYYPYVSVSNELYNRYQEHDLRKYINFKYNNDDDIEFKGSYVGGNYQFGGVANDEIYLIAAECYARLGNVQMAMERLNELLANRYESNAFDSLSITDEEAAIHVILLERRKELLFRNIRWSDMRRLGKEADGQVNLTRMVNGKTYTLMKGNEFYVFQIPTKVVELSGIKQN